LQQPINKFESKKRKWILVISTIYVFYFLFYAVTPLSFSCCGVSSMVKTTIKTPHLFIIELLASGLGHQPEEQKRLQYRFLFLKKRAIVHGNELLKIAPSQTLDVISSEAITSVPHTTRYLTCSVVYGYNQWMSATNNGLSPPSFV
jgi:hypothetical protein